jgi:hypothetical protein
MQDSKQHLTSNCNVILQEPTTTSKSSYHLLGLTKYTCKNGFLGFILDFFVRLKNLISINPVKNINFNDFQAYQVSKPPICIAASYSNSSDSCTQP